MIRDALFYAVAAGILISATAVVTLRNLFHSALALLATLFASAALFLLLGAEMTALAQVLVYIGGILIFVLYAVFLTMDVGSKMSAAGKFKAALALPVAAAVFALLAGPGWRGASVMGGGIHGSPVQEGFASLRALGSRLLDPGANGFIVPFEIVSVLLLAALVGALAVVRGLDGGKD